MKYIKRKELNQLKGSKMKYITGNREGIELAERKENEIYHKEMTEVAERAKK